MSIQNIGNSAKTIQILLVVFNWLVLKKHYNMQCIWTNGNIKDKIDDRLWGLETQNLAKVAYDMGTT